MQGGFAAALEALQEYISSGKPKQIESPSLAEGADSGQRTEAFKEALRLLSEPDSKASLSEESIDAYIDFFYTLYGKGCGFRHMYSDICSVMYGFLQTESDLDCEELPPESLALSNNMAIIAQEMENKSRDKVRQFEDEDDYRKAVGGVKKLHDHIELEHTRLEYILLQNKMLIDTAKRADEAADAANGVVKKIEEAKRDNETTFRKMVDDSKREFVTILGIFAAIVITFTAGSAFSGSVLQNIDAVSIYRLSFMVLAIGFFLFNVIAILLVFIRRVSKIGDDSTLLKIVRWTDIVFVILIVFVVMSRFVNLLAIFSVS